VMVMATAGEGCEGGSSSSNSDGNCNYNNEHSIISLKYQHIDYYKMYWYS
jgi:hypothetical protein